MFNINKGDNPLYMIYQEVPVNLDERQREQKTHEERMQEAESSGSSAFMKMASLGA